MEPVEELTNRALVFNYLAIDRLNDHGQQTRVLKSEVLVFYLPLCEGKQGLVVIKTFLDTVFILVLRGYLLLMFHFFENYLKL